jgi:hypothetical protein
MLSETEECGTHPMELCSMGCGALLLLSRKKSSAPHPAEPEPPSARAERRARRVHQVHQGGAESVRPAHEKAKVRRPSAIPCHLMDTADTFRRSVGAVSKEGRSPVDQSMGRP